MNNKLNIFCASHISTLSRLARFKDMCLSVKNQSKKCMLYISVSLDESIKKIFNASTGNYDNKNIFNICDFIKVFVNIKQSQFLHYKFLAENVKVNNSWLIFTDDDDTHNINRNSEFIDAIDYYENKPVMNIGFINLNNNDALTDSYLYHNYSLKAELFLKFINSSDDKLLKCYLCDAFFVRWMKTYSTKFKNNNLVIVNVDDVLYNYNLTDDSITLNEEAKLKSLSYLVVEWSKYINDIWLDVYINNIILSCLEYYTDTHTRLETVLKRVYDKQGIINNKRFKNELKQLKKVYSKLNDNLLLNCFHDGYYL